MGIGSGGEGEESLALHVNQDLGTTRIWPIIDGMWAWLQSHKLVGSMVGLMLTIIGLAGLPDDILTWRSWIEESGIWLSGDIGRWIVMLCGFLVVVFANADRIPGLKVFAPAIKSVEPAPAVETSAVARETHFVMWCGIRWVWNGRLSFDDPEVIAYCPEHTEVRLKARDNGTSEIEWPTDGHWISGSASYYYMLYCIRGPHTLEFDEDCESSQFGQVKERAVQLLAADLRKQGIID